MILPWSFRPPAVSSSSDASAEEALLNMKWGFKCCWLSVTRLFPTRHTVNSTAHTAAT